MNELTIQRTLINMNKDNNKKLPNSEQSSKGKVKTHKYINRQNQSTKESLNEPLTFNSLNTKKGTTTYDDGNPGHGL